MQMQIKSVAVATRALLGLYIAYALYTDPKACAPGWLALLIGLSNMLMLASLAYPALRDEKAANAALEANKANTTFTMVVLAIALASLVLDIYAAYKIFSCNVVASPILWIWVISVIASYVAP
jgi:phosphatidylglycerophosphate synthase